MMPESSEKIDIGLLLGKLVKNFRCIGKTNSLDIISWIKDNLRPNIEVDNEEHILLFGNSLRSTAQTKERSLGRLIAITHGVVLLDSKRERGLFGLLVRDDRPGSLLRVLPFSKEMLSSDPFIVLVATDNYAFSQKYPVTIFYDNGLPTHGSEGERLYIDRGRWDVMRKWFDKWLPRSK